MILVDTNLLVYSVVTSLPQHRAAKRWLDEQLNDGPRVGLPWASLLAFVRIVGNPRIFERAIPFDVSWSVVEMWLGLETTWVPEATADHATKLGALLEHVGGRPSLVHDAHLAALAIEHGLELMSADRDFARFASVRWRNPLDA